MRLLYTILLSIFITLQVNGQDKKKTSTIQSYVSIFRTQILKSSLLESDLYKSKISDPQVSTSGFQSAQKGHSYGIKAGIVQSLYKGLSLRYGLSYSRHTEYKSYFCHECGLESYYDVATVLNGISAFTGVELQILSLGKMNLAASSDIMYTIVSNSPTLNHPSLLINGIIGYDISTMWELFFEAGFIASRQPYQKVESLLLLGVRNHF